MTTPDRRTWQELQQEQVEEIVSWLMASIHSHGGNLMLMAKAVGLDRSNLRRLIHRHGLSAYLAKERST